MKDPLHEIEQELDDLLVQCDPAGRLRYVSPATAQYLELPPEQCLGKVFWEFLAPEGERGLKGETSRHAAAHDAHWELDSELFSRSGRQYCVKWVVWGHYDAAGRLEHFNAIGHDITHARQTEQALNERLSFEALILRMSTHFISLAPQEVDAGIQQALREIGEYAGVDRSYVFLFSDDGRTMTNTHAWCAGGCEGGIPTLQGLEVARYPWWTERLKTFEPLCVPDVRDLPREALAARQLPLWQDIQSLLLIPMTMERRLVGFIGFDTVHAPKTWSDETLSLLKVVANMLLNALNRQRADEALRRTARHLSDAQRIAHIGSWEHELAPNRSTWSDETYRLLGYRPHSIQPTLEAYLAAIHPDDRERVRQAVAQAMDAYEPYRLDHRVLRPDGSVRVLHLEGEIRYDEFGWPVATRGTLQDTTELRHSEAELARREADLRQSREIDRLKTEFVNAVTHELRTPLASIKGYAEFLADELSGPLNGEQHAYVHQIEEGVRRLERIINDLLDFARLEAGTFRLNFHEADLAEKIREVASSLQPLAQRQGLALESDVPEALLVRMDPDRIGQVLLNLIGNAIKFTRPGGRIRVSACRLPDEVRVEVTDTGIGIAPQHLGNIFQKFYQVDTSLTREVGGAGLGLSISKALIDAHGGRIGVSSIPGDGSTFWFTLPLEAT
ncbi:MAG TPA: ATP-binding protein [Stenomitos sp.]